MGKIDEREITVALQLVNDCGAYRIGDMPHLEQTDQAVRCVTRNNNQLTVTVKTESFTVPFDELHLYNGGTIYVSLGNQHVLCLRPPTKMTDDFKQLRQKALRELKNRPAS